MTDRLFVGIDSGTQGTKMVVFSEKQGKIIASGYRSYPLQENERGGREQDPSIWIEACSDLFAELFGRSDIDGQLVAGIGVSGQQHGCVPLDKKGDVIRPAKLWCDTETVSQCETITRKVGGKEAVLNAVGNCVAAGFTASKLLWLKEKEPSNYKRLDCVLLPHDYINFWLTGERTSEAGDSSGTAYFDVRNRCWSEPLLNGIDSSGKLQSCLPELRESVEPVGTIRSALAGEFGLNSDLLVSSGGGDNMMGAIGTGNVRKGVITASLGTSGTIYGYSDQPILDPTGELAAFCSSTGGWLPLVCTMNVTVATELTRNLFGFGLEEMNTMVAEVAPGSGGLRMLPYFNGERTPDLPMASGSLHGMTGMNMQPGYICRAAMEGATFGLRYGLDILKRNGIAPSEIRLIGGGARSQVWRSLVADIFDTQVVCLMEEEAGATGAALQALWCVENVSGQSVSIGDICDRYVRLDESSRLTPDPARASIFEQIYNEYLLLNRSMEVINRGG